MLLFFVVYKTKVINMRNAMWVGGGITGMGEIPMLGVKEKGIAKVIRDIFRNGKKGFFYDPSDMGAMYQDAAGTVPVTAAGQPVGLVLDKSKGAASTRRNLLSYTDDFTNASWHKTSTSASTSPRDNGLVLAPDGSITARSYTFTSQAFIRQLVGLARGIDGYQSIWVRKGAVSSANAIRLTQNNTLAWNTGGSLKIPLTSQWQRVSFNSAVSGADVRYIIFGSVDAAGTNDTDCNGSIEVWHPQYELNSVTDYQKVDSPYGGWIAGNHAYQTVSASRPLLGYTPVSGVRNVATYSTNAADASWSFGGTRISGIADSKDRLNAVRWSGVSTVPTKGCTVQKTGVHTVTMRLKVESTSGSCVLLVRNNTKNTNFTPGVLNGTTGITSGVGWTAKAIGNGFWECTFTTPSLDAGDLIQTYFGATDTTSSTFAVVIEGLQVELGATATPLQKTTTLLNVTEDGVASTYSLYFDGVDDFLQTNNIDFTATDKVSLFAGVRKLSDAASGIVCELSADQNSNNGTFALRAPNAASDGSYAFNSKVTTAISAGVGGFTAPNSAVIVGSSDISKPTLSLRVNGVLKAVQVISQGTGNYGNYPLYIGRRGGTNLPFNGHIYGLIGIGKLASYSETAAIEKELAKRTGATLNV